jgi:hypothetical protein
MEVEESSPKNTSQEQNAPMDEMLKSKGDEDNGIIKSFAIVQLQSLIVLLKQTLSTACNNRWDGHLSIKKRDGLSSIWYSHVSIVETVRIYIHHVKWKVQNIEKLM